MGFETDTEDAEGNGGIERHPIVIGEASQVTA
jgi:hypothetical protein